jgi:hypothetical protein
LEFVVFHLKCLFACSFVCLSVCLFYQFILFDCFSFVLLPGGTLQGKQPVGSLAGVSSVHVLSDQSGIVASIANMLRVYAFFHEEEVI